MKDYWIYGIGFFIATLVIQYFAFRVRKGKKDNWAIMTGETAVIAICLIGILEHNEIHYASIIGFVLADLIGKAAGLH
ncbi:hypothetical protein [Butyrivibrio sp. AE3004]|uniref:hypothetical protein n=1 Tax=Butyrivibrio sp. AE3004 TaxID=1506994 RepID=UPI00049414E0|nr:hypothetical protein [Butyrivibrio sp. AE3004]